VRLQRKIVQVVSEVKWSVSLDYLQRVEAARQAARASLEGSLLYLETQAPQLETVRVLVTLSMNAWRLEDPRIGRLPGLRPAGGGDGATS